MSKKKEPEKSEDRGPGRPPATHNKKRYTIILEPELIKKVKWIALREDILISDVYEQAVLDFVAKYEKEKGSL